MSGKPHAIIIGAGLCGSLLAIKLAQRGVTVDLHEKRPDLRKEELAAGRSINLALSNRGLRALDKAGVKEKALALCIPMKGRMIHVPGGEKRLSPYSGRSEDYINSISRPGLNGLLLDQAESLPNINIHFNSNCIQADLEKSQITCIDSNGEEVVHKSDILIGTDGAGSVVRRSMMRQTTKLLFNYSQDFLRHGYKELSILPKEGGGHRLDKNSLHIWPREKYMIIALPNMDDSFTVTMFHPMEGEVGFNNLNTKEQVKSFFEEQYAELIEYMPHYLEEYFENPVGTLGTIKCYPWTAYGKTLIMGDAAHAIVPFYGQGMNASFEDVSIFDELMEEYGFDWPKLFKAFEKARVENANAIADLAVDNFHEMQDHVADPIFIKKRKLEMKLEQTFDTYYSKYSLVTFRPELPYSVAMKQGRAQDKLLLSICSDDSADLSDLEGIFNRVNSLHL